MKSKLITEINGVKVYRNPNTGIAYTDDGTGNIGSAHPNIDASGSVSGMKKLGYWKQTDLTVRSEGYIYNVSRVVISDKLDQIAAQYCRCGGKH